MLLLSLIPFGYDRYALTTEMVLDGRALTLIHPFPLEAAEYLSTTWSDSGELLYLIVKQPRPEGEYFPVAVTLIVARRRDASTYAAVVWHELYPWALKYLGLAAE